MTNILKRYSVYILGALLVPLTLAIFVCLPQTVSAAPGTLGTESPEYYCTYQDADGNSVDGNNLSAGTYKVTFNIKGMASASVLQVTASYNNTVTVDTSTVTQVSDTDTNFSTMGYVAADGNIVFGYVSNSSDASLLNAQGTELFSLNMAFSQQCDAADVITISSNPNHTFALADYSEGYNDEYALVDTYEGYPGSLYLMSADVSPSMGYDITGQVKIATDLTGTETTVGIIGINVSVTKDGVEIASAVTDENGTYTLTAIPAGEYKMTISGESTVDREVTLVVSSAKTVDAVGVVICDYNRDVIFNSNDTMVFAKAIVEYNVYSDFNGDKIVNSNDVFYFAKFLGKAVTYADVTLQ